MRIGLLFPGQGSQYVGMGKETYETLPEARELYEKLSSIFGIDLTRISFYGPETELIKTENTQPAIFSHSVVHYELIKGKIKYDAVAGHSLGEYTALYAGGVLSLEDVSKIVKKRGELMQKAGNGAMLAVIGLDEKSVESVVDSLKDKGVIAVANYNSPEQVVISGEKRLIEEAEEHFRSLSAKRIVKLQVSGAFHSPLMKKASDELNKLIEKTSFNPPNALFYPNVIGSNEQNPNKIKYFLSLQMLSPVQWKRTIEAMVSDGIDTFIEIGPGKVLSGLLKRITPNKSSFNIEKPSDIQKILEVIR